MRRGALGTRHEVVVHQSVLLVPSASRLEPGA